MGIYTTYASALQLVTWAIEQKRERELEDELRRVGISFQMWEERSVEGTGGGVRKWTQPDGKLFQIE